jgi:hypothetical protein
MEDGHSFIRVSFVDRRGDTNCRAVSHHGTKNQFDPGYLPRREIPIGCGEGAPKVQVEQRMGRCYALTCTFDHVFVMSAK